MDERRPLVWPPKIGSRICHDTRHEINSWSGEVRAIVDGDYAVVRRWLRRKRYHRYEIVERMFVEAFNATARPAYFEGPLPRRPREA